MAGRRFDRSDRPVRLVGPAGSVRFGPVFKTLVITNVLKTGPVTEPEKLPVHGSLVGPVVEPWLNR